MKRIRKSSKGDMMLRCAIGLAIAGAMLLSVQAGTMQQSQKKALALAHSSPELSIPVSPQPKSAPAHISRNFGLIKNGNLRSKTIMLTFDDGPHPGYTPQILAVLRKYRVKATFFVVGKMAQKHPELIRAIVADGHLIANHTYDHVRLTKVSEQADCAQFQECNDVIEEITGNRPMFCRPPGCRMNGQVRDAASKMQLRIVWYTLNTLDTIDFNPRSLSERVIRRAKGGSIVLCHDGLKQTVAALPHIIASLQKKGYTFATVAACNRQPIPIKSPSVM